ncbi:MAG: amidohydrolase family protein [Betaproteobacteria bacterium]|nr:amidohydrolase family protein [Betaproteobacteria bacterium]
MKLVDMHSHWGTQRGYVLRSQAELAQQKKTWNSEVRYHTEQEMVDYFRATQVKVILDFGFTKYAPMDEVIPLHDYALEVTRQFPDAIIGNWLHLDPALHKEAGLAELRRCLDKRTGFVGLAVNGSGSVPASDPSYDPFYKLCIEANIPVLIFVGTTGLGAGLPGGMGILLDSCHPRHLDYVAARYPDLRIVAARPGWPWQTETIAVLMHKRNIYYELHGWSPKYFAPDLKHDISRRLKDRIMFGGDYPLYTYERLVSEWRHEGYSEEILQKVFVDNAVRFFGEMGASWI